MAKLAAMGRRRRRNTPGSSGQKPNEPARPIMQLCAADVVLHRAPRSAVEDFLANREPPHEEPGPRRRQSKRDRYHAWLLEREK